MERSKAIATGQLFGVDCYVLNDGRRVLSQRGMVRALTAKTPGENDGRDRGDLGQYIARLPNNSALLATATDVEFDRAGGGIAHGVAASTCVAIWNAYVEAAIEGTLHPSQKHLAVNAQRILAGLGGVGLETLIDRATGYAAPVVQAAPQALDVVAIVKQYAPVVALAIRPFVDEIRREITREITREVNDLRLQVASVVQVAKSTETRLEFSDGTIGNRKAQRDIFRPIKELARLRAPVALRRAEISTLHSELRTNIQHYGGFARLPETKLPQAKAYIEGMQRRTLREHGRAESESQTVIAFPGGKAAKEGKH